ncbi:hypothetical protein [Acrocarpospora phusangensis]|nr:hypothetical protein [Acrocarpospora phusangensis]
MRLSSLRWIARAAIAVTVMALLPALAASPAQAALVNTVTGSGGVVQIAPGASGHGVATCPSGKTAVGGGYDKQDSSILVDVSRPDGNGWRVHAWNTGSIALHIYPWVVCATVTGRVIANAAASVPAGISASATAACPSGRRLTGGGFAFDTANGMASANPNITPVMNGPSGQGWKADAFNVTGVTRTIRSYAVCATLPSNTIIGAPGTIAPGQSPSIKANCPAGQVATGGGFAYGGANVRLEWFSVPGATTSPNNWWVFFKNTSPITFGVVVYAVCTPGT